MSSSEDQRQYAKMDQDHSPNEHAENGPDGGSNNNCVSFGFGNIVKHSNQFLSATAAGILGIALFTVGLNAFLTPYIFWSSWLGTCLMFNAVLLAFRRKIPIKKNVILCLIVDLALAAPAYALVASLHHQKKISDEAERKFKDGVASSFKGIESGMKELNARVKAVEKRQIGWQITEDQKKAIANGLKAGNYTFKYGLRFSQLVPNARPFARDFKDVLGIANWSYDPDPPDIQTADDIKFFVNPQEFQSIPKPVTELIALLIQEGVLNKNDKGAVPDKKDSVPMGEVFIWIQAGP